MSEHDFEPIRGLPGDLPKGEHILWQGAPRWTTLAQQAFHVRAVAAYFAGMFALRAVTAVSNGQSLADVGRSILLVSPIAILTVALLAGLAWLYARTTVYTLTNKRAVIRFGVALPKAFNIPFTIIESAAVKTVGGGAGDLALTLKAPNKIAFAHLWPNVRPWRLASPQPTFRALADVQSVATILASAMSEVAPIELTRPDLTRPTRAPQAAGVLARPDAVAA
jgi:hypothetical protein